MIKSFFKSLVWALIYLVVFLVPQFVISSVATFISTGYITYSLIMKTGEAPDPAEITGAVYDIVMKNALLITVIAGLISVLIFVLIFRSRNESIFDAASIRKISPSLILPCIMLGIGLCGFISVGIQLIPFPESWFASYAESSSAVLEGSAAIYFISAVIEAPIVEELTFRGLIYGKLRGTSPKIVAAIIASALFGLVHGNIIWFIYTFLLSLVMVWTLERGASLICTVLLHSAFNLAGFILSLIKEVSDLAAWCIFGFGIALSVIGALLLIKMTTGKKPAERPDANA